MDEKAQQFIALCNEAIAETVKQEAIWSSTGDYRAEWAASLREDVLTLRGKAENGTLRRPAGDIGWGLGREVGEWANGTDMYLCVQRIGVFYITEM